MDKRIGVLFVAAGLSGQAQAVSFEAIGSLFTKLFKGGSAAKETVTVERAAEGATAAKGIKNLRISDTAAKLGSASALPEPKPNMVLDPIGKNRKDIETYKALRANAEKGDADAMMKMSDMTGSGKVSDPGEPYHGYWLFQATRLGSQTASRKMRDYCSAWESWRATDRWFDFACETLDDTNLYVGDKMPGSYSTLKSSPSFQTR